MVIPLTNQQWSQREDFHVGPEKQPRHLVSTLVTLIFLCRSLAESVALMIIKEETVTMCHCQNEEVKMLRYQYSFLEKLWVVSHQNDLISHPVLTQKALSVFKTVLKHTSLLTTLWRVIDDAPPLHPCSWHYLVFIKYEITYSIKMGKYRFLFSCCINFGTCSFPAAPAARPQKQFHFSLLKFFV